MITGFGNNTVSALASDITSTQTTFSVTPGGGDKFLKLLTTDISNPSSPHGVYAKLTLVDNQQTVFEICHLTAVSNDTLTVIRGQEGTVAKGWALNDVIANFATRGSEQSFVQIEQLQAGDYTTATAGGTPNALAISMPSTFGNNNTNDWLLKSPLLVTPIATNTGSATLQVTLGGKVIGTFPLYKGNKAQLDSGDLLAGVPFICVLDSTKQFFSIVNPVNLYKKLSSLAYLFGVANKLPYFIGSDTAALTDFTQVGRDIIGKADIASILQYLGLGDDAHLSGNLTVVGGVWDTAPGTTPARVWSPNNIPSLNTLGVVDATTSVKGIVELATNAEMATGTSQTLVPPVSAVMSLFSKRTFSTSDYIRIPDVPGGLIVQWVRGTASSTGVLFAQMPTAFPNKLLLAGAFEAGAASWGNDSATTWGVDFANSTTTQVIAYARRLFPTTINAEAATGLIVAIGN